MANQLHQLHPPPVCRISQTKPLYLSSILPQPRFRKQQLILFSSLNNVDQDTRISTAETPESIDAYKVVKFNTLGSCKLGISRYPDFDYNAEGGTGRGIGKRVSEDEISVEFDLETLYIPPLNTSTTKFLGLPLPPFLRIDIAPELFRGTINKESGKVDLEFKSKFWFSVGSVYRAPALLVETVLTSEESIGTIRRGKGEKLGETGRCKLVGVATVQPIDDFFMDSFLRLPTECLASLNAIVSFCRS